MKIMVTELRKFIKKHFVILLFNLCLPGFFSLLPVTSFADTKLDLSQYPDLVKKIQAMRGSYSGLIEIYRLDPPLQIFRTYQLLNIDNRSCTPWSKDRPELEHPFVPGCGTRGLFAYNGRNLIYLSQQKENVEKLLMEENTLKDAQLDLEAFAKFLAATLLEKGTLRYRLVSSLDDILPKKPNPGKIKVEPEALKKLKVTLATPQWEEKEGKKVLVFYYYLSNYSQPAKPNQVNRVDFSFSKDGSHIDTQDVYLIGPIYKDLPNIMARWPDEYFSLATWVIG